MFNESMVGKLRVTVEWTKLHYISIYAHAFMPFMFVFYEGGERLEGLIGVAMHVRQDD